MGKFLLRHSFAIGASAVFATSYLALWLVGSGQLSIGNEVVRYVVMPGYLVLMLTAFVVGSFSIVAGVLLRLEVGRAVYWLVLLLCQAGVLVPFIRIDRMRERRVKTTGR